MSPTLLWALLLVDGSAAPDFERDVALLLERRCVSCHQQGAAKGGLALDRRDSLERGGEQGPPIVAGRPDASLLLDYVSGDDPEMPRQGPPLTADEVAVLRNWIATGAPWPEGRELRERPMADLSWWSLRPLERPALPAGATLRPIDRFVQAKLAEQGLGPSPEADRRTLIRRLTFDLIGLPPTPEEVAAYLADEAPDAYERLVERLLNSPRYGERWARHWLDVVHYGETHGYDKDQPRPNAWPYRDYVIRALNADKPYGDFILEQLAGDVVAPDTVDGLTALGFIAAGPWDQIGHTEVPEAKIDGQIARNLDRDDMVTSTLNTFCSVTVQCARCHAHKFDPISQADYYGLQAIFAALDRAELPFHLDPAQTRARREGTDRERRLAAEVARLHAEQARLAGPRLAELDARRAALAEQARAGFQPPIEHGYHSAIEPRQDAEKWVQLDLGTPVELVELTLHPCHDDFNGIGSGFGFPVRYRVDLANDPEFQTNVVTVADRTAADVPNPRLEPQRIGLPGVPRRYVRITATKLAPRSNDFIFALAEVSWRSTSNTPAGQPVAVTARDTIEALPRWSRANLVDGRYPRAAAPDVSTELAGLDAERDRLLESTSPPELRHALAAAMRDLAVTTESLQALPPPFKVYAGMIHHGRGPFLGTGPDGGRPRTIRLLHRGDVTQPRDTIGPAVLPWLPDWSPSTPLTTEADDRSRRLALAEWITDRRNPLTWRSIVNRLWQYHFGRGLVDSPNDFGRMGQLPSHPELLDWLACEFRDGGQSWKALHRLIVTSATYRQVSTHRPEAAVLDAGNTLLWRAPRRKLDAEAVRDSLLAVAGRLDLTMGGPSFQDFVVERPEHSPHYEYHLHDPRDPRSHRRSVYRFLVRSQPQPFMNTLDCADPSISVDKRNETINALQALALLNNGLTVYAAEEFAGRLRTAHPGEETDPAVVTSRLQTAYELALARPATAEELARLSGYARAHGWPNTCRVLLNLNEFAFVD